MGLLQQGICMIYKKKLASNELILAEIYVKSCDEGLMLSV